VLIGSHVPPEDPLATAAAEGADIVQIFLGDPQSWRKPKPREDVEALRASSTPIYVHAPYLVNLASPNNKIRIPSRKILQQTCDAAAEIGARAVIVHGGHVTEDDEPGAGFERWRKGLDVVETDVPIYLENTAGGDHAMARHFDTIAGLWEHIGDTGIGFCLDTCHAYSAGEDLAAIVDRVKAITGRIDLVHCNNSRDEFASGRDRHAPIESGTIDPAQLLDVVRAAGAPAVSETPDPGADITWLRAHLGAG